MKIIEMFCLQYTVSTYSTKYEWNKIKQFELIYVIIVYQNSLP